MKPKYPSFPASREAALNQWEDFLPNAAKYAALRNYVVEGNPNVSRLSPAIRCRLITEEEILNSLRQHFSFSAVEKFVQELLWRGYWKAWLECHQEAWSNYRRDLRAARDTLSGNQLQRLRAIQEADSGIAVIDRFTRELLETGYLHNHARMWWASYWIHAESLPWQLGADFFYRHLLDGDAASNTLSWRWVAGYQTRGKAYLVRRSNIETYLSPTLLDQTGLEKLEDNQVKMADLHDIPPYRFQPPPASAPPPKFAGLRWGLCLHEEDLNPESLSLPDSSPVSIRGFIQSRGDSTKTNLSPLRWEYINNCLRDAISRAGSHWHIGPDRCALLEACSLADELVAWADHDKLDAIVLARPAVGFLRDQLPEAESILKKSGVQLIPIVRPWDESLYPHAKGGFFSFWELTKPSLSWS